MLPSSDGRARATGQAATGLPAAGRTARVRGFVLLRAASGGFAEPSARTQRRGRVSSRTPRRNGPRFYFTGRPRRQRAPDGFVPRRCLPEVGGGGPRIAILASGRVGPRVFFRCAVRAGRGPPVVCAGGLGVFICPRIPLVCPCPLQRAVDSCPALVLSVSATAGSE